MPGVTMAVADMDGDGRPDIAVSSVVFEDVWMRIWNEGDGEFTLDGPHPRGLTGAVHKVLVDLNGNGWPDLATATHIPVSPTPGIVIHYNEGDRTFLQSIVYTLPEHTRAIAAADFNLDGATDLAILHAKANVEVNMLSILVNRGDGTFGSGHNQPADIVSIPLPFYGLGLAVADVDNNGSPDLIVSGGGAEGNVVVLLNQLAAPNRAWGAWEMYE